MIGDVVMDLLQPTIQGRGANANPANPFSPLQFEPEGDELDRTSDGPDDERPAPQTVYYRDTARTIIAHNDSPDVGFEYSINPYRGCSHGCIYCYARPTHEYLSLGSGLDFESKIFVKSDAAQLLRKELSHKKWEPKTISI